MAEMLVKTLNQRHPSRDQAGMARRRALVEGGCAWKELVETWIIRHPQEAGKVYAARKERALYENHAGPLVNLMSAAPFAGEPAVSGFDGEWEAGFVANCNRSGASVWQFMMARLNDALTDGEAFTWVNLPARSAETPEPLSRGDEVAAGLLDAYLVPLLAEQVIDWGDDSLGRLSWLMAHDCVSERTSVDTERTKVLRWTFIDAVEIVRWEWRPRAGQDAPTDGDVAIETIRIQHGFGRLPVIRFRLPQELYAMARLEDPAIAHLRARNDLSWALHMGAHPILSIRETKGDDTTPLIGDGYYLRLRGEKDEAKYIEPSGANFELLRQDVHDLREAIYRVVQQMAASQGGREASKQAQTAESKGMDWKSLEIILARLATEVAGHIADALSVVAAIRGAVDPALGVSGLDGWQQEELSEWLISAAGATEARMMSDTFTREVAKRQAAGVLARAEPALLDKIRAEIDAAPIPSLTEMLSPASAADRGGAKPGGGA